MDPTTNAAFMIFAAISPLLISFIKQKGFSSQVNALIALICYAVVGVVGAILGGEALTIENAVPLITFAGVIGTAAYNLFWRNLGTGPDGQSPSLEQQLTTATSFIK